MAITAAVIILFALWQKQSLVKTVPTLITLAVQILLARANRVAFLLGSFNSILYSVGFYDEGLHFQAVLAVAVSAPMQAYSYFNWKKNTVGELPSLRSLSPPALAFTFLGTAVGWGICYFVLGTRISPDGEFVLLDTLIFALGIVVTLLSAFRYADAQYISLFSSVISLVLWIYICRNYTRNLNYVAISVYNLYMAVRTATAWTQLCKKQI